MELIKFLSTCLKAQTDDSEIPSLLLYSTRGTEKREKTGQQNKLTDKRNKKATFPVTLNKDRIGVFSHMRYALPPAM